MTLESLLSSLDSRGVVLLVEQNALRFRAPVSALTTSLKQEITAHRTEIINRLRPRSESLRAMLGEACRCQIDDWTDAPPTGGQIRTYCGRCGRFIGYCPENVSPGCRRTLEFGHPA